ncbi:Acetyl-coenzyme A synthetase, cytoplasmic [Dermatophagoides pteronyssinus]|uniref:Acetyl-coenzyme A synthetase n=2 Tax=Dermatophagoides pteronyssinus TaxID=6956 RepID=A0A6P6XY17_DERPT|nr:acetyl-coenzyme A synthetase, cytoplasmic-like [Dermatophagoides pteronyssinus]KAH9424896.1 Acetyl-coenzyme A synthetase, cytoplasmic [Dermatophagoides pteronyssinus]
MAISDFNRDQMVYPSDDYKKDAYINNMEEYRQLYKLSIEDPVKFWHNFSKNFHWEIPPRIDDFLDYNFDLSKGPIFTKWMKGARTNICYNALDRHVHNGLGDRIAYYWEGNETHESRSITYTQLLKEVCKFANFLLSKGVKKGDRIAIYMPVTIDLVVAMLATVRIGAVHTVVFAGFSAESLSERIIDARCSILVTMDGSYRGKKFIPLKDLADNALEICRKKYHKIRCCIVQRHSNACQGNIINGIENGKVSSDINNNFPINWNCDIDIWWQSAIQNMSDRCEPVWIDAEDDLFILYTSGSTGKPKGVLHTLGGYMVYAATTFKYTFNYTPDDVFFCTADLGWITGHTVNVYGSLANAATIVLFEGTPFYPYPGRLWEIIDKLQVSIFYTAPTAIRSLMKYGDEHVKKYKLDSLKLLGTAGEPINEEAWCWYYKVVGKRRCPIVDTFWQTETAAPMLTPLPGCTPTKPGSATLPFFSIAPAIVDFNGKEIEGPGNGILVIKKPWPSIARTVVGNHERYEMTYFHKFKGYFSTGDGCYRDQDGYYWITGRADDMLNVSGHLLSTAQVESAIVEHKAIAEAAAVSSPHPIKGECIYCFVVLHNDYEFTPELEKDIKDRAREKIGALAAPEVIHPISALPKTRSGKIMRRILSKVIRNDTDLGDISTMADESILEELFTTRHLYSIVALD